MNNFFTPTFRPQFQNLVTKMHIGSNQNFRNFSKLLITIRKHQLKLHPITHSLITCTWCNLSNELRSIREKHKKIASIGNAWSSSSDGGWATVIARTFLRLGKVMMVCWELLGRWRITWIVGEFLPILRMSFLDSVTSPAKSWNFNEISRWYHRFVGIEFHHLS